MRLKDTTNPKDLADSAGNCDCKCESCGLDSLLGCRLMVHVWRLVPPINTQKRDSPYFFRSYFLIKLLCVTNLTAE